MEIIRGIRLILSDLDVLMEVVGWEGLKVIDYYFCEYGIINIV